MYKQDNPLYDHAPFGVTHARDSIRLSQVAVQTICQILQRIDAWPHRADHPPRLVFRSAPMPARVLDGGQDAGIDQGGLAGAAVTLDLQPAVVHIVQPETQTGQGIECILLPAEEETAILSTKSGQAAKWRCALRKGHPPTVRQVLTDVAAQAHEIETGGILRQHSGLDQGQIRAVAYARQIFHYGQEFDLQATVSAILTETKTDRRSI